MVFKRQLTPLSKGGAIHKHRGKGSQSASMPSRNEIESLATPPTNTINDYAKATPMAQPAPDTDMDGM